MNEISNEEIKKAWNMVFNLALNFLHDECAAEEAAQEIFLKASGALDSFRHEAALSTWIYRIAYNHLVDQKRLGFADEISFEIFERDVHTFAPYENELCLSEGEMGIYVEQIKIGCTKAMLQCLDATDRFVFIIGKLFEFSSKDGAFICGMGEGAYRQRLSRAAKKITNFMTLNCGLVNEGATCQCRKRIGVALERGRINPDMLLHHTDSKRIKDFLGAMNDVDSVAEIFRDNPFMEKAALFTDEMQKAVEKLANAAVI